MLFDNLNSKSPETEVTHISNILAIIPARGGSKGVPRKNIRPLCGKPLLAYTAETALESKTISRIVLSTEDDEIAAVGRQYGLDVPFMRPPELALDDTPTLTVIQHALHWLETRGQVYDAVCLLQPTNPLRQSKDIDNCIALLNRPQVTAVISVLPVPLEYNPHWVYFADQEGYLRLSTRETQIISRRQLLPPAFHRDGSIYLTRREVIMVGNSLYGDCVTGYPMPPERSINIDTMDDFLEVERLLCK